MLNKPSLNKSKAQRLPLVMKMTPLKPYLNAIKDM